MLLVIFGAGASHDCMPLDVAVHARPPLTDQLFHGELANEIIARVPEVAEPAMRLRARGPGLVLEEALEGWRDETGDVPLRRRQLNAIRFYLRELMAHSSVHYPAANHGMTNYSALAGRIEEWRHRAGERVLYVTFNYDWILDDALRDTIGLGLDVLSGYVEGAGTRYVKIHGSADWWHRVTLAPPVSLAERVGEPESRVQGRIVSEATDDNTAERFGVNRGARAQAVAIPALSIPVRNKAEFACPPEQIETLKQWLGDVDRVLSIGWRGNDRHFVDEFARRYHRPGVRPLKVIETVAISAAGAGAVLNTLTEGVSRAERVETNAGGFREYLRKGRLSVLD